jgi:hypothetical protein
MASNTDTGSHRPVFTRPRRLAPDKLKIAEAEFKKFEKAGIIRRSNSAWALPLHMVQRKLALTAINKLFELQMHEAPKKFKNHPCPLVRPSSVNFCQNF